MKDYVYGLKIEVWTLVMQELTYYALKFINFDEDVNIFEFICIALVRFAPLKTVYHGTDNDASIQHTAWTVTN